MRLCPHLLAERRRIAEFEYLTCRVCHQVQIAVHGREDKIFHVTDWLPSAGAAERAVGDWLDGPESVGALGSWFETNRRVEGGSAMAFDRVPEEFERWPIIVADVSGVRDPEPRPEAHRLAPTCQDGSRALPDGSSTAGLGVTACGRQQATRGHGWYLLANAYQLGRIERGDWPICHQCLPLGITRDVVASIREQKR